MERDERIAKGFVGVIAIVVGAGLLLHQAEELIEEFRWISLAFLIVAVALIGAGIGALIRPKKFDLSES